MALKMPLLTISWKQRKAGDKALATELPFIVLDQVSEWLLLTEPEDVRVVAVPPELDCSSSDRGIC